MHLNLFLPLILSHACIRSIVSYVFQISLKAYVMHYFFADSWFLYCCYFLRTDAASTSMESWFSCPFNVDSCRVQLENTIPILLFGHCTYFTIFVSFTCNFSTITSFGYLHHSVSALLFVCKCYCCYCDFGIPADILRDGGCASFHQDQVRLLLHCTFSDIWQNWNINSIDIFSSAFSDRRTFLTGLH